MRLFSAFLTKKSEKIVTPSHPQLVTNSLLRPSIPRCQSVAVAPSTTAPDGYPLPPPSEGEGWASGPVDSLGGWFVSRRGGRRRLLAPPICGRRHSPGRLRFRRPELPVLGAGRADKFTGWCALRVGRVSWFWASCVGGRWWFLYRYMVDRYVWAVIGLRGSGNIHMSHLIRKWWNWRHLTKRKKY